MVVMSAQAFSSWSRRLTPLVWALGGLVFAMTLSHAVVLLLAQLELRAVAVGIPLGSSSSSSILFEKHSVLVPEWNPLVLLALFVVFFVLVYAGRLRLPLVLLLGALYARVYSWAPPAVADVFAPFDALLLHHSKPAQLPLHFIVQIVTVFSCVLLFLSFSLDNADSYNSNEFESYLHMQTRKAFRRFAYSSFATALCGSFLLLYGACFFSVSPFLLDPLSRFLLFLQTLANSEFGVSIATPGASFSVSTSDHGVETLFTSSFPVNPFACLAVAAAGFSLQLCVGWLFFLRRRARKQRRDRRSSPVSRKSHKGARQSSTRSRSSVVPQHEGNRYTLHTL